MDIRYSLQNIAHAEKGIVFGATLVNIIAYALSLTSQDSILKRVNDILKNRIFIYIVLNLVYFVVIGFSIVVPLVKKFAFRWSTGLRKIK